MSGNGLKTDAEKENKAVASGDSEEEDDPIDEEQLYDYKEMIEELGGFPVSLTDLNIENVHQNRIAY